jgi:hypothetical protein
MIKAGRLKSVDTQKKFTMAIGKKKICDHYVDFWVENFKGEKWVEEVKGVSTAVWQLKKKLFEALYPDIKYIVIPARGIK